GRRAVLVELAGPVVVDLVIVEADEPGHRSVRRLQVRVAAVLRIAPPVVVQRIDLAADVAAQRHERAAVEHALARAAVGAFVYVVAVVEDEVQGLLGDPAPGREMALLQVLAAGHGEAHAVHARIRRRERGAAADRTGRTAYGEAIPVRPSGRQALDLDMHGMRELRPGQRLAIADDAAEAFVLG